MTPAHDTVTPPRRRRWPRWLAGTGGVVLALAGAVLLCEWLGWPFLRRPAESWLSQRLDRMVTFDGATDGQRWQLRLLGRIRLHTDSLQISAPGWSTLGPTLVAREATLSVRYRDLLALREGEALRVESLQAGDLTLRLERQTNGRASWQFGRRDSDTSPTARPAYDGVRFDLLEVRQGTALVDDKLQQLSMLARFQLREMQTNTAGVPQPPAQRASGVQAQAEGHYRNLPLHATLRTGSALPWLSSDAKAPAVPVTLRLDLGRAKLAFDGHVRDLLVSQGLSGNYSVSGPSLAAVGEPLGITLPTTRAFSMQGDLTRDGTRWRTQVSKAVIGRSKLAGEFQFDKPAKGIPMLSGELRGTELWLADLGPAVGVPVAEPGAAKAPPPTAKPGRVLPDKRFDLPSLRAMNADVNIKLDRLEAGTALLQDVQPLHAHLVLQDGVLDLKDIDARVAHGQLAGHIRLDGREAVARWDTRLRVNGVKIEQWLRLPRSGQQPPYATGFLGGRINLQGQGRSTAELLATLDGRVLAYWTRGTLSHIAVEAIGIDVAQALGLLVTGDNSLPVHCGVADLRLRQGRVTPQPLLVDTRDSVLRADGEVQLASERLAVVVRVQPKDISPISLRTPVRMEGTLAKPTFKLEKGPLLARLVPAALLATVHPLAAIIPLVDLGEEGDAESRAALAECNKTLDRVTRQAPAGSR